VAEKDKRMNKDYSENELVVTNSVSGLVDSTKDYEESVLKYINDFGSSNGVNDLFISGMVYLAQELETNPKTRENIIWSVIHKKIVEKTEYNLDIQTVNIDTELKQFLKSPKLSDITRKNYTRWLGCYLKWCTEKKLDSRKIKRMEAENYLFHLDCKYAPNTTRSMILSVSSFYTFLMIRYPDIFHGNPFYKLQLPKIKLTRRIDIVEKKDIDILVEEFKRIGRADVVCAVRLMEENGWREGIFSTMTVDKRGYYHAVSKEKEENGKFTPEERKMVLGSGVLKLRKTTLTNIILKYTKKLYEKDLIGCPFSAHDLRHYYLQTHLDTDSVKKFVEVSRKFHKNVNTSLNYCHF
jgi:integrase